MAPFLTVSETARLIGARPRDISDAFYARQLDDTLCPLAGRVRLIPSGYVPTVREVLRELGRLAVEASAT
jgi:hypothetical protein